MSRKAKRGIAVGAVAIAVGVVAVLSGLLVGGGAAPPAQQDETAVSQGIRDVGPFKVGLKRGHERASFSGRPLVQVFVPEGNAELFEALVPLLSDASVAIAMVNFTGVIIPCPPPELLSDEKLRVRAEAREAQIQEAIANGQELAPEEMPPRSPTGKYPCIVIQSLSGPVHAVLEGELLTLDALLTTLNDVSAVAPPVKGPLYEESELDSGVFDKLMAQDEVETVRIARDCLAEIAPGSVTHQAAEKALGSVK